MSDDWYVDDDHHYYYTAESYYSMHNVAPCYEIQISYVGAYRALDFNYAVDSA